jgi:two-component system cell cycle response regulator DivK
MFRILLVEDNELMRDMLSLRLRRKGYDVLTAADGIAGVALAALERPDLVLMDMNLPSLDGWTATRMLKGTPKTALIPVMALTAHDGDGVRDKILEAGCDDYDTKPVDFERLLGKVQALLKKTGQSHPGPDHAKPTAFR